MPTGHKIIHACAAKQNGGGTFLTTRSGADGRDHNNHRDFRFAQTAAAGFQHAGSASRSHRSNNPKKLINAAKPKSSSSPVPSLTGTDWGSRPALVFITSIGLVNLADEPAHFEIRPI
jgi:hypothetical protein